MVAAPTGIESDLALELNGDGITPSVLNESVNAFVGLLRELTSAVCGDSPPVEWRMQVRVGGNLIGASASRGSDLSQVPAIRELAARCVQPRIKDDSAGDLECPDAAREYVRKLARLRAKPETRFRLWVGSRPHEIDLPLVRSLQAAPRKRVGLPGTVEGRLSALHDCEEIYFEVREYIRDRPIKCVIKGDLVDKCQNLWRRRVTVRGIVHYDAKGIPTKVDVRDVEPLPRGDELPSHMDVLGILRKYK